MCKCLNESLSNDTRYDEHGVAYSILPLTTAFYRKLNNGTVDQCIYTRLQAHDVWSNIQFWEMAFYTDVQRSLRPVYLSNEEFAAEQQRQQQNQQQTTTNTTNLTSLTNSSSIEPSSSSSSSSSSDSSSCNGSRKKRPTKLDLNGKNGENGDSNELENNIANNNNSNNTDMHVNLYARPLEKTALEICGEQMEKSSQLSEEQRESFIRNEQGIIRSHVLHYITQMTNMMIPLDINTRIAKQQVLTIHKKE